MSVEAAAGRGTVPGSMTTTCHPRRDNSQAAVRPKTPAPTITIERVMLMLGYRSYERSRRASGHPLSRVKQFGLDVLLLSKRKHVIVPVGNLKVGVRHEGKAGRLAGHARADGPQDTRCPGAAARLGNRPSHRAD